MWSQNFSLGTRSAIFGHVKMDTLVKSGHICVQKMALRNHFGHFTVFGKIYHYGKELGYRENKKCSETSETVGTTWEHALEFQKFSQ